ncbi:MAG TPA: cation:proton antiporter [Candidatus Limnocylindrales bacterium]|nr:cation:proton antiporter [Candidatus Limnocylindrales bacterium]
MDLTLFFAVLGGLLVLAFIANRLVRFTRVPDVIILMATGVLIGPVFHWVNPDIFRGATHGFGTLALILILFEGGLDMKLREIRHFGPGFFLALFSYVLSMAGVAAACRFALHFPWLNALIVGAVLGCISSSILFPVLQQVDLRREVKVTLLVEASLGDALAVLAVTTLLDIAAGGRADAKAVAWSLGSSIILAVACGVLAGMLWSYLLPILSEERFWHVLTFAAVLLVYSGVHFLKGNELVSVLVFGLTLSNFTAIRKRLHLDEALGADWFNEMPLKDASGHSPDDRRQSQMLTFHGELAFLLRTFFFVLLGMLVDYAGLRSNLRLALLCFAAILVARAVAVQAGRLVWRDFSGLERELMVWFVPRGLITAVLGIQVLEVRGSAFAFLPSLAFAIILLTNIALLIGSVRARALPAPKLEATEAIPE